uniref:Uncharacterized protein n=1 Tax=Rhizophora mucronata TaxID=61149 RepID=A0A2P2J226_RHIMU
MIALALLHTGLILKLWIFFLSSLTAADVMNII